MPSRRQQQRVESPNLVIVDGHACWCEQPAAAQAARLADLDSQINAITNKRARVADDFDRLHALRTYRAAALITANDNLLDEVSK
jgi:hypothetical protein